MTMHKTLLILALVAGCGGQEVVVVHVEGDRSGLSQLGVTATLDQRPANDYEQFPSSTTDFGLALPVDARGHFEVDVGGFTGQSCLYSLGIGAVDVGGSSRADVTVTLTLRPNSGC
jgi:hypothetical protein